MGLQMMVKNIRLFVKIITFNQKIFFKRQLKYSFIQLIKLKQTTMQQQNQHRPPLNHTLKLGNLEFMGFLKSQQQTLNLIFNIQKYLETYPAFYINSILVGLKGRSIQTIKQQLQREYDSLINSKSFYHKICSSIEARRKCINKIKRDISKATKFLNLFQKQYAGSSQQDQAYLDWVQNEGYTVVEIDQSIENSIKVLSSIFLDIYRLRDMTIYIVESIHLWRITLEEHADRCHQHSPIYFYYDEKQVYQEILEDISFIWKSKLCDYIWLQAKQDPFIIRNILHIQQKAQKTILERYFLQILYPKSQIIVDKALKCFEMLLFKYKPKLSNLFEQEEMLIENYLKLEMENNMFNEEHHNLNTIRQQQNIKNYSNDKKQSPKPIPKRQEKQHFRGWVFEKSLPRKARQRINSIVQNHQKTINMVKPFNIVNYAQKNSIALAYLSQIKEQQQPKIFKSRGQSTRVNNYQRNFLSEGQEKPKELKNRQRDIETQPQQNTTQSRMFQSLTKLNPVIIEDPKQHIPDTPSRKKDKKYIFRQPSLKNIKINSFFPTAIEKQTDEEKIQIQEEETPLNIKQFYQVFRADTNKVRKQKESLVKQTNKLITVKQYIETSRRYRAKSMNVIKKSRISLFQKKNLLKQKQKSLQKSLNKSSGSYAQFNQINTQHISNENQKGNIQFNRDEFISLKAKSIPYDMIIPYVNHIVSQIPLSSKSFASYSATDLIKKLSDPFIHCIILDLFNHSNQHFGQVILSQSLGGRVGRLKYTIQFLNIHIFELIVSSVLRICEQLLSTTPCQQVICPFFVDKLDLVSSHFIQLIDQGFSERVTKFGKLTILQKNRLSYKGSDVRQRLYVFTSQIHFKREHQLGLKMLGNYRSIKFQCRCLVLTSNFRLRSKDFLKNTIQKYNKLSIGELFVKIFGKILTKYHLKQLKMASLSINQSDELVYLVKKNNFMRNIINSLISDLANQQQKSADDILLLTRFINMNDLLNYLQYKKHDLFFHFEALEESRFILNHQLLLVQFDQEISLEFTLSFNEQLYILSNHKDHQITRIRSNNIEMDAFLLPTTNERVKLFLMNASQYLETNDQVDLFSYLSYFFKNIHSEIYVNGIPSIILPNLKGRNTKTTKVKMYDGFFRLFPEREFYSAAILSCINHWQSYYSNAVIHIPKENSMLFEYPFFIGFYDTKYKNLLTTFLYDKQK